MMKKLDLEWFFDAGTTTEHERLIKILKPKVAAWVAETYPQLLFNLKKDTLSNNSTVANIFPAQVPWREKPVWLFVTAVHNRTMKDDCTAAVVSSEEIAEAYYNAFFEVKEKQAEAFAAKVTEGYVNKGTFVLKNISEEEFHSLYHGPSIPIFKEVEWLSDVLGRVLGVVIHDLLDNDYGCVVLGRDEHGLFRAIDMDSSFAVEAEAHKRVIEKMEKHLSTGAEAF